ncbi:hypothetical protein AcW1_002716 [Taiwanofungus camphoratus]|nr:hypothetical protein AcW1_002716 [Antrodia cinnamomea]
MIINLIPSDAQGPHVYFRVNFNEPCETVPLPAGWITQLQCLQMDELEMPGSVHALDKASWLTAVIDELVFDLASQTVCCTLIDGPRMQWSMTQGACLRALDDVLADVAQSAAELERERTPPPFKAESSRGEQVAPLELPPAKPTKHKKQRSLLSSLVAGLNKLTLSVCTDATHANSPHASPTSSSPSRHSFAFPALSKPAPSVLWKSTVTFLPPPSKTALPKVPPLPMSTTLLNRARSTLVETFRRYVISELRARMLPGGYGPWVARSMLRRYEEHMAFLVQEAGGAVPDLLHTHLPRGLPSPELSGTTLVSEPPFYDEEVDQTSLTDSTSTETDGSSVHTPVDTPSNSPFAHSPDPGRPAQKVPRSPSPAEFSPEDLATYTALSAHCMRLRQLLAGMDAARENGAADERAFLAVLEVKSRRRAWSNRAYMGGARMAGVGLALPFQSSPLARCEPMTPDRLSAQLLDVATGEHNLSKLFPVTEEEEEEEDPFPPVRLIKDAALRDMESGLLPPLQRPQIRSRTHSLHRLHALDLDLTLAPEAPSLIVPPPPPMPLQMTVPTSASQALTSSSLLCQPLKAPVLESQAKFELFDHPANAGVMDDDGSEFTLSMDLPPPYSKANEHGRCEWVSNPDPVQCR